MQNLVELAVQVAFIGWIIRLLADDAKRSRDKSKYSLPRPLYFWIFSVHQFSPQFGSTGCNIVHLSTDRCVVLLHADHANIHHTDARKESFVSTRIASSKSFLTGISFLSTAFVA